MKNLRYELILLACFILASQSEAAVVYEIAFDQAAYDVAPGNTADVRVLFREIRDAGDVVSPTKLAVGNNDGLFAAGFVFNYAGGDNAASLQSFTLNAAADRFDPAFSVPVQDNRTTKRFEIIPQARNLTSGIELSSFSDSAGRDVFELEVGRFSLQNVGSILSVTQLSLATTGTPFSVLFADFSEPTSITFGSATFGAVTAVPEPSSIFVIGGIGLTLFLKRKRLQGKFSVAKQN